MKLITKLNQSGAAHIVALSVVGLALVAGVGYKVFNQSAFNDPSASAAASTGGAEAKVKPYVATAACKKQLLQVNGFKDDLARFKSNHYVMPTDLSNYEQKPMKHSDGVTRPTYTGVGTVPSYANGKVVRVKRTNFVMVLQRHQGALVVLQTKASVNTKAYEASIAKLSSSIDAASAQIDSLSTNWSTDNASCANRVEAKKTKALANKRNIQLKLVVKSRKDVENSTRDASKTYNKAAIAFRKAKA